MKRFFRSFLTVSAIAVFSTLSFAEGLGVTPAYPAYPEVSNLVLAKTKLALSSCDVDSTSWTVDIPSLKTQHSSGENLTATLQPASPAPTIDQYGACVYRCLQSNRNVPGKESYCANACSYLLR